MATQVALATEAHELADQLQRQQRKVLTAQEETELKQLREFADQVQREAVKETEEKGKVTEVSDEELADLGLSVLGESIQMTAAKEEPRQVDQQAGQA